jgi:hypothetical protein
MKSPAWFLVVLMLPQALWAQPKSPPAPLPFIDSREEGFESMFDGKSLAGWDGNPRYWRVDDGVMVGEVTSATILQRNSFLIWRGGQPRDFELKVEYRVSGEGNSGISYRNLQLSDAPWSLSGYQADIDGANHDRRLPRRRYTGNVWEERGRRFLAWRGELVRIDESGQPRLIGRLGENAELEKVVREEDWNSYHLIIRGNTLIHVLNDHVMSIVIDDDVRHRRMEGLIGVQVHIGAPHKIEFRNWRLKKLDLSR